ncbi:hypothetical protein B0T25DRAFT_600640 [Lasiosphaeria hispida]|uniref:Uncharacterized protein n=1 Tax=Lasiosphaeria hispida TaxID=260671 RepID=A0AAJ0HQU2_9PEZI|nr:hypothetical protein B0T25DRAFT_600640 [Lasiosphaeria hispida]
MRAFARSGNGFSNPTPSAGLSLTKTASRRASLPQAGQRQYAVDHPHLYEPSIQDLDHLTVDMTLEQADDCCNKSVAIYIMSAEEDFLPDPLLEMLHIYLYDKWPGDAVDILIPVHAAISNRAEEARLAMKELDPARLNDDSIVDPKEFFILQPLFRALAIVIRHESFDPDTSDIGQLTAMLVRTGTEEGLSSPISSDPIAPRITGFTCGSRRELAVETTLETTVDFVMDLEKREVAAFGPRPDPVASTEGFEDGYFRGPAEFYEAICLGWPEDEQPFRTYYLSDDVLPLFDLLDTYVKHATNDPFEAWKTVVPSMCVEDGCSIHVRGRLLETSWENPTGADSTGKVSVLADLVGTQQVDKENGCEVIFSPDYEFEHAGLPSFAKDKAVCEQDFYVT